jgi:hypothetical protein
MRLSMSGEDLTGLVVVNSVGRLGVITGCKTVVFGNGDSKMCWTGIGFDGNGLYATSFGSAVAVVAESLDQYVDRIESRPDNLVFGKVAVNLKK